MEEQGTTTLRDVLRNVPGISMQAGEGNPPAGDQLKLRGFSSRNDFFFDGMRDVGSYFRDPFNIKQVEVFKGPASMYSGRGSTGGTINMSSKMPTLDRFVEGTATAGGGATANSAFEMRLSADANQPLSWMKGTAIRLNAMAHSSEVSGRDEVEDKRWGVAPSLSVGLGTPTRLTLSYFHMTQDNVPDYGMPNVRDAFLAGSPHFGKVAPVAFANYYGYARYDHEDIDADMVTLRFEHDFHDRLTIRNQFRYSRLANESIYSAPRIVNDGSGQIFASTQVVGNRKFRDQADNILINQTDLTYSFDTAGLHHILVTGIELSTESAENKRRLDQNGPASNLFHPNPNATLTGNQLGVYNGTRARLDVDTIAFYVTDTVKLTERWSLGGGLRWEKVDTRVRGFDDAGNTPGYVSDFARSDPAWSGRASLVYKPVGNASVYVSYATSFEPTASLASTNSGVVQLAGGNNNLPAETGFFAAPEQSKTYEIGTKWDLMNSRLSVTGAVFRIDKTNARNTDPVTGEVTIDGEQRVNGFELGIAGKLTDAWSVFGGYTFLASEIRKSNLGTAREGWAIDNTPRHTLSLWTTYLLQMKLLLGAGVQFVDDRTSQPNNANNARVTVDSYWRFDAMAAYPLTEQITRRLNLLNLTDEKYIDQLASGQSIPGQRFTALLSTSVRF